MSIKLRKPLSLLIIITIIIGTAAGMNVTAAAIDARNMTFEEFVVAHLDARSATIDVSHYWGNSGLTSTAEVSHQFIQVLMNNPQLFHINAETIEVTRTSAGVTTITGWGFHMTRNQQTTAKRDFDRAVTRALTYARNAETDFEKALLLHDYLVLNVAYDKDNLDSFIRTGKPSNPHAHNAYGALVEGLAVCDGYARAYHYLLRQVGVESRYAEGLLNGTDHIWNVVNIDGSWFHVDVTANDPLLNNNFDRHGFVSHKFFLLSQAALLRHGDHKIDTARTTPPRANSTTYDRAFFRDVTSAIIKLGDFYYWFQFSDARTGTENVQLRRRNIDTGRNSTVLRFESIWYLDGTEGQSSRRFDLKAYSSLAAYNGILYYNTAKELRSYNPETREDKRVFAPSNMGGAGNRFIYGMTMNGRRISYSVQTTAAAATNLQNRNVPAATATSIALNSTSRTMDAGAAFTLRATLTPGDSADFIHWVSSDPSIATVSAGGRVTAVSSGRVTITAHSDSGRRRNATITVR